MPTESADHVVLERDNQIRHIEKRGVHESRANDLLCERLPIYQHALDVSLAVAPNVAEKDEVATVEDAELERIDFAFEGVDAKV